MINATRVIFHHSGTDKGDVDSFRRYHIHFNGWIDIGYHFVVLPDGGIQKGRSTKLDGAHAKGRNKDSYGVCMVGDFRKYEPSIEQIYSCGVIYHDLCRAHSKTLKVEFHHENCPGKQLDRNDFLEQMSKYDPFNLVIYPTR